MVHLIFRKSARELRERAHEAPPGYRGKVDAYARSTEEADWLQRQSGYDRPNQRPILCDDGGKAERDLRRVTLRSMGLNPDRYMDKE